MSEQPHLGQMVKRIHGLLHQEASRHFADTDLTPAQGHFLVVLHHQKDDTARMKEMENSFHCAQSTIAGIAARLEKKQLIASFTSPEDRRVKCVRLTDEGRALCESARLSIVSAEEKMLSSLTDAEKETLNDLLTKCMSAFDSQLH